LKTIKIVLIIIALILAAIFSTLAHMDGLLLIQLKDADDTREAVNFIKKEALARAVLSDAIKNWVKDTTVRSH
jgi:hypothetical protein